MKKSSVILYMFLLLSCAAGEEEKNIVPDFYEPLSDVAFTMKIAGEDIVQVRSILSSEIESKVSDVTLAAYGPDGILTDAAYYDSGFDSMPFEISAGGLSNIYALVNVGDMSDDFPMTENDVRDMEYYVHSYEDIENKGFPMSGVLEGFSPESSDGVIPVERLFAKLCVRITHKGLAGYLPSSSYSYNMCNKSLYVRQANRRLIPFSERGSKALTPADVLNVSDNHQNLNDRNAYQGSLSQAELGPGPGYAQDTTLVFYVPENVQGNLLPANRDPFGKVYEEIADIGGRSYSDYCTYLEFNARRENTQGYSGEVKYRYYLGADNTSDFSLVRNRRYDITLDFTEEGFFVESWKVTRGEDWNDRRVLKFIGDSFLIQPGETIDIMIHYRRDGQENADSQNVPGDWELKADSRAMAAAGLDYSFDSASLQTGTNGYKDFLVRVSASADAQVGASVPMRVATLDGEISDEISITVMGSTELSSEWSFRPEYVAQEGVLSFLDVNASDLPLSVSISDESKVSCERLSDSSFGITAIGTGKVTIAFRNAAGTKSAVADLDIKAPYLKIEDSAFQLNPDGEIMSTSYEYQDKEGKALSNINATVFDSCLLPIVESASCFRSAVTSKSISMEIVTLTVNGGSLELGGSYDAKVKAAGCGEVVPVVIPVKVNDPFEGMTVRDYGTVDDYTLFDQSSVNRVLRNSFQDKIKANESFEYQAFVPMAASAYVSAVLEPLWTGDFSSRNGVFKAEFIASSGKIRLSCNPVSSSTEHSAGRHNMMLYVTNRHSLEKIGRSCGTLDVYVHTAIGARAVFGSQECGYNPFGNETFASVYNDIAGQNVYSSPASTSMIHYMDVSLEWMTDVSKVYVWNRMKTAAQSGASWMDALDIVRPSVADGQLNSNTRMLYSVMEGSDSRISVCGEKYGPRKGIGRVLYRALLQPTYSLSVTDLDRKLWFFGYQTVTGSATQTLAPCYTLHDMNKGSDMKKNIVDSRTPYHFSPSACGAYVDDKGRGYHIIHFLEDISPETYGWINLL